MRDGVNLKRVRTVRGGPVDTGPVLYWMRRDQRIEDNWALLYAQQLALEQGVPLAVVLTDEDPDHMSDRQRSFMQAAIPELRSQTKRLGIPLLHASTLKWALKELSRITTIGTIITDFSPLRHHLRQLNDLAKMTGAAVIEVDAHNIVPCRVASERREYAAYTLRPKLNRLLPEFLEPFPRLEKHPHRWPETVPEGDVCVSALSNDEAAAISRLVPGPKAAERAMMEFLTARLSKYDEGRNDPNSRVQSGLSPYLHFGHLSAQRLALEAQRYDDNIPSQEAFLEELIVRRELSDNFCLYTENYDSPVCFPDWARKTLEDHLSDPREYVYDSEQLERSETHDQLWNAAQTEMRITGIMPGYLRMYWAKKILEWTPAPETALAHAIYLNDRYSLDGNDPNGYAGIAWSIGGVHDRAWFEREIFGKIRYMSYAGCRRKFDVDAYVESVSALSTEKTR